MSVFTRAVHREGNEDFFFYRPVKQAEICWLFVNSRRMAADNAKYMGHEGSTDVITLQYKQVEQKEQLFGDVIICIDEAILYAEEYSTTPQSEIIRYLIHSILHLQGYNDINPSDRKIMKRHENKWVKWAEERITSKILQQK